MPYKIQKVKGGYVVETQGTNKRHSNGPMSHEKAMGQMKALYANMTPAEKAQMAAHRAQHDMMTKK